MKIAVIGTRDPSGPQIRIVREIVESLDKGSVVVSGCADGIDKVAIEHARNLGISTEGHVPWPSYNSQIQGLCKVVHVLSMSDQAAFASVDKYHPAPGYLSMGARKLHGRNYRIIFGCDSVIAAPSNKRGLGGTGQGIRIALGLGIPLTIIGNNGVKDVDLNTFDAIVAFVQQNW